MKATVERIQVGTSQEANDIVRTTVMVGADSARRCGDCQLCCKILPTKEIEKPANQRCQHQRVGKGCAIYANRPMSCAVWSCLWLTGEFAGRRPDRTHYVVDPLPDYITFNYKDDTPDQHCPVVQVWVDPAYRDAWRDPALLAFLEKRHAESGDAAIIRYSERDGFLLFPPAMTNGQGWVVESSGKVRDTPHTLFDVAEKLGGLAVRVEVEDK
jgi:hypothetical protein